MWPLVMYSNYFEIVFTVTFLDSWTELISGILLFKSVCIIIYLYTIYKVYNICSTWFLDIVISTCFSCFIGVSPNNTLANISSYMVVIILLCEKWLPQLWCVIYWRNETFVHRFTATTKVVFVLLACWNWLLCRVELSYVHYMYIILWFNHKVIYWNYQYKLLSSCGLYIVLMMTQ